ncbi:hypothetical protein ACEWY4_010526 [Coilia grayii]|uniref:ribonuclease H n=1 Tax=Coilia grayii TaxID=363190 RepID=A0ABD1K254_9TELE
MWPYEKRDVPPLTDARPRRQMRPPAWVADYEVTLPAYGRPPSAAAASRQRSPLMQEPYYSPERPSEMLPLHPPLSKQWTPSLGVYPEYPKESVYSGPQHQSTPDPLSARLASEVSPAILEELRQMREDNRRLQLTMMEMQRQFTANKGSLPKPPEDAAALSQPLAAPPVNPSPPSVPMHAVVNQEEDEGDQPLPPPQLAKEDPVHQPSTTILPTSLVAELTTCLKRMGMVPEQPSRVPTPQYYEPYAGSFISAEGPEHFQQPPAPPARSTFHVPLQPIPHHDQRHEDISSHQYRESVYRGPKPNIPDFKRGDPREFARLKLSLENLLPTDATERFKYQILIDHLKFEDALLIADSYTNSPQPYTDTMASLIEHYGQPHQLALRRIADLMEAPNIRSHDAAAFKRFALRVRALVGMLDQLGDTGQTELQCGSHVSRLMSKLPPDLRAEFMRYVHPLRIRVPTLLDFADWLEYELKVQEYGCGTLLWEGKDAAEVNKERRKDSKSTKPTTVLHGAEQPSSGTPASEPLTSVASPPNKVTLSCPYCVNAQHYLNQCTNFSQLTNEQQSAWIKSNRRCWRCARSHQAAQCRLKARCRTCGGRHLDALHDLNPKPAQTDSSCLVSSTANEVLYINRRPGCGQVLLKVTKVVLHNGDKAMETYAILDDGSERTMLLQAAAKELNLHGESEQLTLRTVRQDVRVLQGMSVSFTISPAGQPRRTFQIQRAFTADQLGLAEHSQPVKMLQRRYKHLKGLPLHPMDGVQPTVLIGSDYPHLITPVEPVRLGPPGGPAAVKTRLGWTIQGPTSVIRQHLQPQQCLHIGIQSPADQLRHHVEKLWQMDVLPYRNERMVTRSKQDQEAVDLLEARTVRVDVNGVQRYATPLLRVKDMPCLHTSKEAVLANLRSTERRLLKDPARAASYRSEISKLEQAGYVVKIAEDVLNKSAESWFIPHHMVTHNGKDRIVFNCSFTYKGQNLNELLVPGPTLTSSLLGVLLRFREHAIAISSDIKGMFHQVRLLPKDRPLLRFLWRDLVREVPPSVYEWQVLPFGTTCSPCCATYALQKHVADHSLPEEDVRVSIERCFYVDNHLQSLSSTEEARQLVNKLKALLATGGFELRQWASNVPKVISHLPTEVRSESSELWLTDSQEDPQELALGYKCRFMDSLTPTMRNIYSTLARLYDPLGFLIPFTTRAKVIVQHLWKKEREWDDPSLPEDILKAWLSWKDELQSLPDIVLPRCYTSPLLDDPRSIRSLHIFCDASEKAYGSVAYLHTEFPGHRVEVAFLTARSRVAPKRQQTMPRLELCAALTGAQLAALLQRELTLKLHDVILWTDSTTVLTWLQSDSCRFKVFVGTRVAEIQEMTNPQAWRYVDSTNNPADDITRGQTLNELAGEKSRWSYGPAFLYLSPQHWPIKPETEPVDEAELRKATFCGSITTASFPLLPDTSQFTSFKDLVESVVQARHGAVGDQSTPTAEAYQNAERDLLRLVQADCFAEDLEHLSNSKPVPSTSRLITLAPEYDPELQLIRVGGRLRRSDLLESEAINPIVLDPAHQVTKLIIQRADRDLCHPGSERLFAELRRKYWILRGREAVKRHQHSCPDCQRWRAKPTVPQMADLPPARLRLMKPPFFSTGVDCFGPFNVRVGRRTEKRWGILFKCLTTRAVHIDVLSSLDTDSFLMALRRFISRRGKPAELLSDRGTNFRGGERELHDSFKALHSTLQSELAKHQVRFLFNPPGAPHFGGVWEREIRSIKSALYATIQSRTVTEEVLRTVLIEVEGILNSKPLGYVSSDVADLDPVTPNMLLMGRHDPCLPQVVYTDSELLSQRRWRHTQVLADQFWKHFMRHYLPSLQTRAKWQRDTTPMQPGAVAMVVDPQLPRALWPVGYVTRVISSADGRIRAAEISVKDRTYTRPVARLVPLPALPDMAPENSPSLG